MELTKFMSKAFIQSEYNSGHVQSASEQWGVGGGRGVTSPKNKLTTRRDATHC